MNINMKKAREAAGFSQKQVAITLKVSAPTVSDWEAGKISPSAANLKKLTELYHVTADYLLGSTDDPTFIKDGKKIWSPTPINILVSQYHVSTPAFSSILGIDLGRAEQLIYGAKKPTDEEYEAIANFFGLNLAELKRGVLPLFTDEKIQDRVDISAKRRFAAYDKTGNFSQQEIEEIDNFIEYIKSKRKK